MTIAGIKIGVNFSQIQWQLTGCMCAVNDGINPRLARPPTNFCDGEDEGGGRSQVADSNDFGARCDGTPEAFHESLWRGHGEGHGVADIGRACFLADELPKQIHRAIFVISG